MVRQADICGNCATSSLEVFMSLEKDCGTYDVLSLFTINTILTKDQALTDCLIGRAPHSTLRFPHIHESHLSNIIIIITCMTELQSDRCSGEHKIFSTIQLKVHMLTKFCFEHYSFICNDTVFQADEAQGLLRSAILIDSFRTFRCYICLRKGMFNASVSTIIKA